MSSTTLSSSPAVTTSTSEDDGGLSQTEWIVIIVVLVIILIVLIIAIAKCLEFNKPPPQKSLIQNDEQSMRSETGRSLTTRSMASTRSRPKSMTKLPLNAEITRFSAGRVSRSAEYGVVIKDIKKTVQEPDTDAYKMSVAPPEYQERVNTLQTYREDTVPRQTLSSPPNGNLVINEQYATQGLAPPNSKAVFVAPDELYSTPRRNQPVIMSNGMQVQSPAQIHTDRSFPLLTQPALILQ